MTGTMPEPTPTAEHADAVARVVAGLLDDFDTVMNVRMESREVARRLLTSTDPAVHVAMLDALARAGVLTEVRINARLNEDGSLTTDAYIEHCNVVARQFVTPWEVAP